MIDIEPVFVLTHHAPPFGAWHHDMVDFADLQKRLPEEVGACK
jgi:hypothetical protein